MTTRGIFKEALSPPRSSPVHLPAADSRPSTPRSSLPECVSVEVSLHLLGSRRQSIFLRRLDVFSIGQPRIIGRTRAQLPPPSRFRDRPSASRVPVRRTGTAAAETSVPRTKGRRAPRTRGGGGAAVHSPLRATQLPADVAARLGAARAGPSSPAALGALSPRISVPAPSPAQLRRGTGAPIPNRSRWTLAEGWTEPACGY